MHASQESKINNLFLGVIASVLLLSVFTYALYAPFAMAVTSNIDITVSTGTTDHLLAGSRTVVVSDTNYYAFYRDSTGECAYSKTTNSGASWSAATLIDDRGNATDCITIAVWYDQWTPNATSGQQYIHVATMSSKDVLYNRVDTANADARLGGSTAISASTSTSQVGTYVLGANAVSIVRATDGTIYIGADDVSDSFVVRCFATSTSCGATGNWSEAGTRPQDLQNDYSLLQPLTDGHVMIINRDISAEDMRSKIWNGSAWSSTWTVFDPGADDNTTYDVAMDAVTASSTGQATTTTYFVYLADHVALGTNDDARTARYSNGAWATSTTAGTTTANIVNNSVNGLTQISVGLEKNTDNVTILMSARTTAATAATGRLFSATSTDSMNSWTTLSQMGTATDYTSVDIADISDERIFGTWVDSTADDLYGETLANLTPPSPPGGGGGGGGGKQSEFFFGLVVPLPFFKRRICAS